MFSDYTRNRDLIEMGNDLNRDIKIVNHGFVSNDTQRERSSRPRV